MSHLMCLLIITVPIPFQGTFEMSGVASHSRIFLCQYLEMGNPYNHANAWNLVGRESTVLE